MCYDSNARPPDPPQRSGDARGQDLVLTSKDGTPFAAYTASPEAPASAQVLILPDVRGLHQFYKELALRFAEVGIQAIAIDYFGRTAGLDARDESFEFWPHVEQMQVPHVYADIRAALEYLDQNGDGGKSRFVLGFCRGGSLALLCGTQDFGLAGVIPFYAGLSRQLAGSNATVLEEAAQVRYPVLGLFGGADAGIPASDVQKLEEQLDAARVEHEIIVYPGAPHSFFDRKATEFAEASTDAWRRVLDFISAHSRQAERA